MSNDYLTLTYIPVSLCEYLSDTSELLIRIMHTKVICDSIEYLSRLSNCSHYD